MADWINMVQVMGKDQTIVRMVINLNGRAIRGISVTRHLALQEEICSAEFKINVIYGNKDNCPWTLHREHI
jgi:hypothetical protein